MCRIDEFGFYSEDSGDSLKDFNLQSDIIMVSLLQSGGRIGCVSTGRKSSGGCYKYPK